MSIWAGPCNRLRLVRGDSGSVTIACQGPDGAARPFAEGETVRFTVKERDTDREAVLTRAVTQFQPDGTAVVALQPEDTAGLSPGCYCYDVRLVGPGGETVDTIVPRSEFRVEEAVGDV